MLASCQNKLVARKPVCLQEAFGGNSKYKVDKSRFSNQRVWKFKSSLYTAGEVLSWIDPT